MTDSPTVLVVRHEEECPLGWVGEWLTDAGVELDERRPYADTPLPADLAGHAGLVVLGGHMGANDDDEHAWLGPTKALVREAAAAGTPALGICLGHQLMAAALGGVVERNPAGKRSGVHRIGWLPDAGHDPVLGSGGEVCVQSNQDVVTQLPPEGIALARNEFGELQAARFAPTVWGVQWHPEAGEEVYGAWARMDAEAHPEKADALAAATADVRAAEARLRAASEPMLRAFAAQLRA